MKSQREKQIERGAREEHKEHPWLSFKEAERVAKDHIRRHPREYSK